MKDSRERTDHDRLKSTVERLEADSKQLTRKEIIDILFKEYDTLRAEIIGRTNGGFQFIGVMALISLAVFSWWSSRGADIVFWVGLGVAIVALAVFILFAHRDIRYLAQRISEVEKEINAIAGAELLQWEHKWGSLNNGWLLRRKPIDQKRLS